MFADRDVQIPSWYMEGMAELFGTHRIDAQGRYRFRVMPDKPEHFDGLGRIPLVRTEISQGHWKSLEDLWQLTPAEFLNNTAYAWSWAACRVSRRAPAVFTAIPRTGPTHAGRRIHSDVAPFFCRRFAQFNPEWALFTHQLQYGFDLKRAAINFQPGKPLAVGESRPARDVAANRGWQASGIAVKEGHRYEIDATGEVTLAKIPKPWVSQPQGISIVYSEGEPIGTLLAAVRRETGAGRGGDDAEANRGGPPCHVCCCQ